MKPLLAAGMAIGLLLPAFAAAQDGETRDIKVHEGADSGAQGAIGLRASFDRPKPVYTPGETLGLTVTTDREATIEIWEVGVKGTLTRILPDIPLRTGPNRPVRLPLRGQQFEVGDGIGTSELLIIARAGTRAAQNISREAADPTRPSADLRQEVHLRYSVVRR